MTRRNHSHSLPWTEIAPQLHTWEAYHAEWKQDVRAAAYRSGRSILLVDPLFADGAAGAASWAALDRLVRTGLPVHVVLTVFWHERSAPAIVARHPGVRVWCPAGGGPIACPARRYRAGVRLPGGLVALATARRYEVVLWLPRRRTLFAGDVLLGGRRQPLRLCPAGWLPAGATRADLAASLAPLRTLPVEILHLGHGAPLTHRARVQLGAALDAAG